MTDVTQDLNIQMSCYCNICHDIQQPISRILERFVFLPKDDWKITGNSLIYGWSPHLFLLLGKKYLR